MQYSRPMEKDEPMQAPPYSAENRRLLDENLDLAARLTTAQIRRLQVEKILLESRIEEQRAAAALAQTQVSRNP